MKTARNALAPRYELDERARLSFVRDLRRYVLDELARGLRGDYHAHVEPKLASRRTPTPQAIHGAMRSRDSFRFYSALRTTSQDMLYQYNRAAIERDRERLRVTAARLDARHRHTGSLRLRSDLIVPRSVSAIDIHLMPGSYHTEYEKDDLTMGAVYENRLASSTFGLFGPNLDDIGRSIATFVSMRNPPLRPRAILDLGCTVGHNTGPWKEVYPQAEVYGIDVAAPCLRYARARALSQRRAIHFAQMDARKLDFPDASFDIVFSSMFLHEVPARDIPKVLGEAHRILRPGGLMLHMELPPQNQLSPWDSFYLDWDGHFNNEPFYRGFRAMNLRRIVVAAGFNESNYEQHVVPSLHALGPGAWRATLRSHRTVDGETGRLATGVRWFCFGASKSQ